MNSYDSATCDSCLDLCSLSAWLRSPGSHKEQVNYIKTVLDSTQNNNTAVTSETCSHWPSNIQKLNWQILGSTTAEVTNQDKQDHMITTWLSVLKVLLQRNWHWSGWQEDRALDISVRQEMYRMSNGFQAWMTLTTAEEFSKTEPYQILKKKITYTSTQGGRAASGE